MRIRLALISTLALSCFALGPAVSAQQPDHVTTAASHGGGELNSLELDTIAVEQQSSQERIFVIARLGRGESADSLNQLRLKAARAYLNGNRGIELSNLVLAAGERVDGEGRVEFYLGSKLRLISLAQRGRNVVLNCCEDTGIPWPRHRRRHSIH